MNNYIKKYKNYPNEDNDIKYLKKWIYDDRDDNYGLEKSYDKYSDTVINLESLEAVNFKIIQNFLYEFIINFKNNKASKDKDNDNDNDYHYNICINYKELIKDDDKINNKLIKYLKKCTDEYDISYCFKIQFNIIQKLYNSINSLEPINNFIDDSNDMIILYKGINKHFFIIDNNDNNIIYANNLNNLIQDKNYILPIFSSTSIIDLVSLSFIDSDIKALFKIIINPELFDSIQYSYLGQSVDDITNKDFLKIYPTYNKKYAEEYAKENDEENPYKNIINNEYEFILNIGCILKYIKSEQITKTYKQLRSYDAYEINHSENYTQYTFEVIQYDEKYVKELFNSLNFFQKCLELL